jgi:cytochrome c551/c552
MSSTLVTIPFRPVLNLNGTFESRAILTVYKADGTTLEPIYANAERTIPLNNPLTADGYGIFPPVYVLEDQPLRVRIQQSNGTTIFDVAPYISNSFDAENILSQAAQAGVAAAEDRLGAEAAKVACQSIEATVQALVGPTYASISAGLAATPSGQFFAVVIGDVVSIYLNNAGSAVFQRSTLSATAIQTALDGKAALSHTHIIANVTGLQTALDTKAPLANPAFTGTATVGGLEIGFRDIPRRTTTTTAVVGDRGGCVAIAANITIPNGVFSAGHAINIYNNTAGDLTILQGSGLTLRLAASATTGNRTIAGRGMASIWFNSASEAIISGAGVT